MISSKSQGKWKGSLADARKLRVLIAAARNSPYAIPRPGARFEGVGCHTRRISDGKGVPPPGSTVSQPAPTVARPSTGGENRRPVRVELTMNLKEIKKIIIHGGKGALIWSRMTQTGKRVHQTDDNSPGMMRCRVKADMSITVSIIEDDAPAREVLCGLDPACAGLPLPEPVRKRRECAAEAAGGKAECGADGHQSAGHERD